MIASKAWQALAAAAPGSRVVLRLEDGREIDIDRIEHFAGMVVVTPAQPVTDELDALSKETVWEAIDKLDAARSAIDDARSAIDDAHGALDNCG